ncbi:MAG: winged helix-turn-helix transcriptional regulator [Ruminococcaceae bacterium]|nr:winged helix-turn-helix transcriptional regulator [Oscillospiraceae bacterium]
MNYQVMVLSEDTVFARMLELEFSYLHLQAGSASSMDPSDRTDVLILDLDSASAPMAACYRKMIGFSRHSATAAEDAGNCSMILRRPFRMSLLRREVLAETGGELTWATNEPPQKSAVERRIVLDEGARAMICDGKRIALSPCEYRIMECLLKKRGAAVTREELSELIGYSETNKTDVYVCYLRRKTDDLPGGRLIRTVRGKGYMIPS